MAVLLVKLPPVKVGSLESSLSIPPPYAAELPLKITFVKAGLLDIPVEHPPAYLRRCIIREAATVYGRTAGIIIFHSAAIIG